MMRATIGIDIPVCSMSMEEGHSRLGSLIDSLGRVHPSLKNWFFLTDEGEEGGAPIKDGQLTSPFRSRGLEHVDRGKSSVSGFYDVMSTSPEGRRWKGECLAVLVFDPRKGAIAIDIEQPEESFGQSAVSDVLQDVLVAVVQCEPVLFASMAVSGKPGHRAARYQVGDRHLFEGRPGWMSFVPHPVMPEMIPEADNVLPVDGKGSVVISVGECFDVDNVQHIKRARLVRHRMAKLGLLDS